MWILNFYDFSLCYSTKKETRRCSLWRGVWTLRCGLHRGLHTNFFSQKLTGVGYTRESGLTGVGYTGESGLTGVGYTGESRLPGVAYTSESLALSSSLANAIKGTIPKK